MVASTCTERVDPAPYHPPVKRSIEIAGHKTSISLEPLFWDQLKLAAGKEGVPVNALVARIDAERIRAKQPTGLASAIRVWLAWRCEQTEKQACKRTDHDYTGDPTTSPEQ